MPTMEVAPEPEAEQPPFDSFTSPPDDEVDARVADEPEPAPRPRPQIARATPVAAPPRRRPPAQPMPRFVDPTDRAGAAERSTRGSEAESLRQWLEEELGPDLPVKVHIIRMRPEVGPQGENIGGALETVSERVDEDYVRETWGGGTFQLKVMVADDKGSFKYWRARSLKIAGAPKMYGQALGRSDAALPNRRGVVDEDSLTGKAFTASQEMAQRAQLRAEKLEDEARRNAGKSGLDVGLLQALNAPLLAQLQSAQENMARLQQQVYESMNRREPSDPFRDGLIKKAIEGESTRIEAMRERHDDELRRMRENHASELKQLREQFLEDKKADERRHERELAMQRDSLNANIKSNEVAYATRTDSLKSETERLNRELAESRGKIGALELKKDQSLTDKVEEITKLRDVMENLGGGDDKDGPWYTKVIDAIGNSEAAIGFINKIGAAQGVAGAPGTQPQLAGAAQPELPPIGVPYSVGDGNIYVRNPDGSTSLVDPRAMRRPKKKKRRPQPAVVDAAATEAEAGGEPVPELDDDELEDDNDADALENAGRPPDPNEVKIAVNFMENAIRNGKVTPEQFAQTARSLVPADILTYIIRAGIDPFLNKVAKLEAGSPLTTQNGRNYARAVHRVLLEGS